MEYFVIGHDRPASAFAGILTPEQLQQVRNSPEMDQMALKKARIEMSKKAHLRIQPNDNKRESVTVLYGGIGDARHLYASLVDMSDSIGEGEPHPQFYFTVVDIKAAVVARDLVMLYILKRLTRFNLEERKSEEALEVISLQTLNWYKLIFLFQWMALIEYVYLASTMPYYLHTRLLDVLKELEENLKSQTFPHWIYVDPVSIPEILGYVQDWY